MERLIIVGIMTILLGFVILIVGILSALKSKGKVEGGGIIFIGPFPIGGATSERTLYITLLFGIIVLSLFILLNLIR
jgi:uncharacterized membrane protein